jgi:hypothetical protein
MQYEKPEILQQESAVRVIQNSVKMGPDFDTLPSDATYRSDEE